MGWLEDAVGLQVEANPQSVANIWEADQFFDVVQVQAALAGAGGTGFSHESPFSGLYPYGLMEISHAGVALVKFTLGDVWFNYLGVDGVVCRWKAQAGHDLLRVVRSVADGNSVNVGNNSDDILDASEALFRVQNLDDRVALHLQGFTTQTNPILRLRQNDGASGVTVLEVSNSGTINTRQVSAPAAPAAGYRKLYSKSDGVYMKNSANAEAALATDA